MKNLILAILSTILIIAVSDAQSQQQDQKPRADSSITAPKMLNRLNTTRPNPPEFKAGDQLIAYELAWQTPKADTVIDRLAGALAVMHSTRAKQQGAGGKGLREIVTGEQAGDWIAIDSSATLAKYTAEYDELRLINQELDAITDFTEAIDDNEALKIAEDYLQQLGENDVIDARLYRQAVAQIGYKMAGAGSIGERPDTSRIVEYRVTYRPTLHGIEMANAGVRLGILASGELVSMRVGGITPVGEWDANILKPSIKDSQRTVEHSPDELMESFYNSYDNDAKLELAWSKVMYAASTDQKSATVEPMLIVSYSEVRTSDGYDVVSRRKMLGYSLTSKEAKPIDFDSPVARHAEIKVTRDDNVNP